MLSQEQVEQEEEDLRSEINQLPDEARRSFYRIVKKRIKDPDTYAVLNWFFLAGLHHFYLGRWVRGAINMVIFLIGIACILCGSIASYQTFRIALLGLFMVLGISAIELIALFRSQIIVQHYNNEMTRKTLKELKLHWKKQVIFHNG